MEKRQEERSPSLVVASSVFCLASRVAPFFFSLVFLAGVPKEEEKKPMAGRVTLSVSAAPLLVCLLFFFSFSPPPSPFPRVPDFPPVFLPGRLFSRKREPLRLPSGCTRRLCLVKVSSSSSLVFPPPPGSFLSGERAREDGGRGGGGGRESKKQKGALVFVSEDSFFLACFLSLLLQREER